LRELFLYLNLFRIVFRNIDLIQRYECGVYRTQAMGGRSVFAGCSKVQRLIASFFNQMKSNTTRKKKIMQRYGIYEHILWSRKNYR